MCKAIYKCNNGFLVFITLYFNSKSGWRVMKPKERAKMRKRKIQLNKIIYSYTITHTLVLTSGHTNFNAVFCLFDSLSIKNHSNTQVEWKIICARFQNEWKIDCAQFQMSGNGLRSISFWVKNDQVIFALFCFILLSLLWQYEA